MSKSKLFDLVKAYSFLVTPVILVYSVIIMLDENNVIFGISGAIIFILALCIFLVMANFKDIYSKLYRIFYYSYSIIASIIILLILVWQAGFYLGFSIYILGKDLLFNDLIVNIFFSIIIILGIGSLLLKLIKLLPKRI